MEEIIISTACRIMHFYSILFNYDWENLSSFLDIMFHGGIDTTYHKTYMYLKKMFYFPSVQFEPTVTKETLDNWDVKQNWIPFIGF